MDMANLPQGAALLHQALRAGEAAEAPLTLEGLAARLGRNPAELGRALAAWAGVEDEVPGLAERGLAERGLAEPGLAEPGLAELWPRLLGADPGRWLLAERRAELGCGPEPVPEPEAAPDAAPAPAGVARSGALRLPYTCCAPAGTAGMDILWGWFDGPFGRMAVAGVAEGPRRGLCGLGFAGEGGAQGEAAALADLRDRWPRAGFLHRPAPLVPWVEATLRGSGEVPLLLIGSPLELAVWQALLEVPSGRVVSYSQVARRVGRPRAVRAVASAIGRNPLSWLVPCHRALRKSGALGGYYWGLPTKRALLAREVAREEAQPAAAG